MKKNNHIDRRDFLKLTIAASASYLFKQFSDLPKISGEKVIPNIIVLVFDAWTAEHVSFMGYKRNTMPNLAIFADRSTVFHNHYSAGTFTVPGTASLLTGVYPWSHHALQLGGLISKFHEDNHIFSLLHSRYITMGYAQNKHADQILYQAGRYVDRHLRLGEFDIQNRFLYPYFKNDMNVAFASFYENLIGDNIKNDASLFLGPLFRSGVLYDRLLLDRIYREFYPLGMPDSGEFFLLEDLVDGTIKRLSNLQNGTFAYFHFYPPHDPYRPQEEFYKKFKKDGYSFLVKEPHPLSQDNLSGDDIDEKRSSYDEYIASWDNEVSRLFDYLDKSGLLDNSYVIVTSDHGELFERGEIGHFTHLIYESVMHVPLLIHEPGQSIRKDVHVNTSSVDIVPTLAHITGIGVPNWTEGRLLPGFGGIPDPSRSVFTVDAKLNSSFAPLEKYSASVTRDRYRLTHYSYPDYDNFEFYDLENDPDEVKNVYPSKPSIAMDMQTELTDRLADANRAYRK